MVGDRLNKLFDKWLNRKAQGDDMAVLWHLSLRHHAVAMTELARQLQSGGHFADPFSSEGLAYRAYRLGDPTAAYNLAMDRFNRRDLQGYRLWLNRAARSGDNDAKAQFRHFETRLPHEAARDIGRHRPYRKYD